MRDAGVEIESEEIGQGELATRGRNVVVRLKGTLSRGDIVLDTHVETIKLGARIEGMRID